MRPKEGKKVSLTRRTFLSGLSALFGAASVTDLRKQILDAGRPILLTPQITAGNLYVSRCGTLFLGDHNINMPRPTWRQYWHDTSQCDANSADALRKHSLWYFGDFIDYDTPISDDQWEEIYELTYDPMPAAYHLLNRLKLGPKSNKTKPKNGRLDFFAGSNHPGSNDLWVEAYDNLTVSLLQAQLIQLRQPVRLVMEAKTVIKSDEFDHNSLPSDE
jgi:hypothetical protein